MSQAATRKAQREEARNAIESYLYRVRDMIEDPTFESVSKDAERSAIVAKTEELSAWLSDDGETADTSTLKSKRSSLATLIKPLETRLEQSKLRFDRLRRIRILPYRGKSIRRRGQGELDSGHCEQ